MSEIEPEGLWVTIAELARLKGISRQSASERVDRLEHSGHLTTRRQGRSRLVELASYDHAIGRAGDAAREIGTEMRRGSSTTAPTAALRDAQTDRAHYDAKLKALDFAERTRQVVPVKGDHGLETALIKVSETIIRDIGAPMSWISEVHEAALKGEPQLRRVLQEKVRGLRADVAKHLLAIAAEAATAEEAGIEIDIHFEERITP
ncbi:winged helix-turn-helix transcriptional regulator [Rhizobium sp. S-51]|uniref:Winged helix-turn-helix transcriptional regulator n=1 Tax=Rhizobium terricola TaxID=2728849 RepID=A0A7Y0AXG4_9HYPH|nr:winged helix-turn-helix domain-containing protein [Rhizobium terricola]NML75279.1 winged helix-turn-helix transcriptional regulator [Rhizobium terricola]